MLRDFHTMHKKLSHIIRIRRSCSVDFKIVWKSTICKLGTQTMPRKSLLLLLIRHQRSPTSVFAGEKDVRSAAGHVQSVFAQLRLAHHEPQKNVSLHSPRQTRLAIWQGKWGLLSRCIVLRCQFTLFTVAFAVFIRVLLRFLNTCRDSMAFLTF